jgi:hypothetical protein
VYAENHSVRWRLEQPRSDNIANAAGQNEVGIPLASPQQLVRQTLGELRPARIEQRGIRVERGVVSDVFRFRSFAQAGKASPIYPPCNLVEDDVGGAREADGILQGLQRLGPGVRCQCGILQLRHETGQIRSHPRVPSECIDRMTGSARNVNPVNAGDLCMRRLPGGLNMQTGCDVAICDAQPQSMPALHTSFPRRCRHSW